MRRGEPPNFYLGNFWGILTGLGGGATMSLPDSSSRRMISALYRHGPRPPPMRCAPIMLWRWADTQRGDTDNILVSVLPSTNSGSVSAVSDRLEINMAMVLRYQ